MTITADPAYRQIIDTVGIDKSHPKYSGGQDPVRRAPAKPMTGNLVPDMDQFRIAGLKSQADRSFFDRLVARHEGGNAYGTKEEQRQNAQAKSYFINAASRYTQERKLALEAAAHVGIHLEGKKAGKPLTAKQVRAFDAHLERVWAKRIETDTATIQRYQNDMHSAVGLSNDPALVARFHTEAQSHKKFGTGQLTKADLDAFTHAQVALRTQSRRGLNQTKQATLDRQSSVKATPDAGKAASAAGAQALPEPTGNDATIYKKNLELIAEMFPADGYAGFDFISSSLKSEIKRPEYLGRLLDKEELYAVGYKLVCDHNDALAASYIAGPDSKIKNNGPEIDHLFFQGLALHQHYNILPLSKDEFDHLATAALAQRSDALKAFDEAHPGLSAYIGEAYDEAHISSHLNIETFLTDTAGRLQAGDFDGEDAGFIQLATAALLSIPENLRQISKVRELHRNSGTMANAVREELESQRDKLSASDPISTEGQALHEGLILELDHQLTLLEAARTSAPATQPSDEAQPVAGTAAAADAAIHQQNLALIDQWFSSAPALRETDVTGRLLKAEIERPEYSGILLTHDELFDIGRRLVGQHNDMLAQAHLGRLNSPIGKDSPALASLFLQGVTANKFYNDFALLKDALHTIEAEALAKRWDNLQLFADSHPGLASYIGAIYDESHIFSRLNVDTFFEDTAEALMNNAPVGEAAGFADLATSALILIPKSLSVISETADLHEGPNLDVSLKLRTDLQTLRDELKKSQTSSPEEQRLREGLLQDLDHQLALLGVQNQNPDGEVAADEVAPAAAAPRPASAQIAADTQADRTVAATKDLPPIPARPASVAAAAATTVAPGVPGALLSTAGALAGGAGNSPALPRRKPLPPTPAQVNQAQPKPVAGTSAYRPTGLEPAPVAAPELPSQTPRTPGRGTDAAAARINRTAGVTPRTVDPVTTAPSPLPSLARMGAAGRPSATAPVATAPSRASNEARTSAAGQTSAAQRLNDDGRFSSNTSQIERVMKSLIAATEVNPVTDENLSAVARLSFGIEGLRLSTGEERTSRDSYLSHIQGFQYDLYRKRFTQFVEGKERIEQSNLDALRDYIEVLARRAPLDGPRKAENDARIAALGQLEFDLLMKFLEQK